MKALNLFFIFALAVVCLRPICVSQADERSAKPDSIPTWCKEVQGAVDSLKWKINACNDIAWKQGGTTVQGRPIVYSEFGDPEATNVTLVFAMVHGDEITPLYIGLELARWLKENAGSLGPTRVIVAPLVNPDGFFRAPRWRMNGNGVDVNRNLATEDWKSHALRAWKNKFHSDPRRFPGNEPGSEPETVFQQELIKRLKPKKIISVHAPLNFLDYDGPTTLSLAKFPREYVQECLKLRKSVKATSSGFFPGSLGNFAGHDLGIPTFTLELPSADPRKAEGYWKKFSEGIRTAIEFVMESHAPSM
jgi:protein MpaA